MYYFYNAPKQLIDSLRDSDWHPSDIEQYCKYYSNKTRASERGGMNGSRDSDRMKVYRSEWAMQRKMKDSIKNFKSINEAEKRMKQILNSKLWNELSNGRSVSLIDNKRMGRRTAGRSCGYMIELSTKTGLDEYTLIHEMTHCLPKCMNHSVQFRINLLKLVSRFISRDAAQFLKSEFKSRKLKLSLPKPRDPESWLKSKRHMEKVRAAREGV